ITSNPGPSRDVMRSSRAMHPSIALLLTVVMVLANAFFVASEFAFVKIRPTSLCAASEFPLARSRPTRLQQLAREGRVRARLLLGITGQLPAYLSASQLGITLAPPALGSPGGAGVP